MYNNQQGILDSLVSKDKIQLRGGGICSSQSQSKKVNHNNQIEELKNKLQKLINIKGVPNQQLQPLIKESLDLIVNIYKNGIENQTSREENEYHQQFHLYIEQINKILIKKDSLVGKWCLEYYLELIKISLENLSTNVSKNKAINIIVLFIKISRQNNNNESILQLIETANMLLIDVQGRYYHQLQKLETYFFFNTLKQIIKENVTQGLNFEVKNCFDKIKHQYIENSSNWILHNCWIEFLVDLLIYCQKYQQQQQNQLQTNEAKNIIAYINNYEGKNLFEIYIKDFNYKILKKNRWKEIPNYDHEIPRLQRILSMFTSLVKQIDIQFQEFKLSENSTTIYQIYQNIYSDFIITQIYSLEMLQSVYKIKEQIQNQQQEVQQMSNQMKSLFNIVIQEIESHFKIESIVNCYCQLQIIEINNFDKATFFTHKISLQQLKSQIEKFSSIITVVQTLILQVRLSRSNIKFQQNHLQSFIQQILDSKKYQSIQQSSPTIESWEDLSLQINIHLLKYKNIKLFQKIYICKFQPINSSFNQDTHLSEIKEKRKKLKELKPNLDNQQQLNIYKNEFFTIIGNSPFNPKKYISESQTNRNFWDDQKFPLIYQSQYQEIEQIRDQSQGDEYKVSQCLKFHFQTIKDNPVNQKLITSLINQIQPILNNMNNSNIPSLNNNKSQSQKLFQILKQVDSSSNISTQGTVGVEKSLELEQIIKQQVKKIKQTNKMYIPLKTQQKRYNDSGNQFVKVDQQRELFNEFSSDQDPKDFLNAEINDFIWSNKNQNVVLLISGPNGCGKTKTLKRLENQLLQHYKVNPYGHNWIPIYVNLFKIFQPEKNLLFRAIESQYFELNTNLHKFYQAILKGQENVVLILDNYDSTKNIILSNQLQKKIKNIYQNLTLKIIMATRKDINSLKHLNVKNMQFTEIQLINSDQQQEYIKQSYKRLIINEIIKVQKQDWEIIKRQIDSLFNQIPIFYLMPENTEANLMLQLREIINNIEFEQLIQQKMKKMKYFLENLLIPYLKDILLTPLLLKIAIKHFQKDPKQLEIKDPLNLNGKVKALKKDLELILLPINAQMFSKYTILKSFINQCHEYKRKSKLQEQQLSLKDFLKNLKFSCLNDYQGQSQQQSSILINNQKGIGLEILDKSSSTNSRLITFNNNCIQFLHQQILDFFIAQKIVTLLQNKGEITEFLNNEQVNLSQKQNEGVVELLIDSLKNDEFKESVQLTISDKSKIRASSNAIFLLSKMGACLKNWVFKGIKIENTSMIGLNAINCDFTESEIKNVEIDFCNFNCCKLNKAVFTNVSCCEFPEINETAEVLQVISFNEDRQLAVLKQNGKVNIWNIETVEREQVEIENLVKNKYKQIIISKDDSTLFALTDHQIDFWNLRDNFSVTSINLINETQMTHQLCIDYKYMCLSPDNTLIMCGVQNQDIEIVKYTKKDQMWRKQQMPLSIKQDAVQMAINHSNELLVVRNTQNQIKFFNLENSNEILIQQQIFWNIFTTTTDGERLIILHNNQIAFYQFKISNGTLITLKIFNIPILEDPIGLHICENSQTILIQGHNQTQIFYENKKQLQQLPNRFYGENSVLSRNGKIFINWKDNKVQLWDLETLNKTKQREAIDDYIKCCQYSPDGQKLLIISSKKTLFYNINQNTYHWAFESFSSFCFNAKKEMLVTFSEQGLKFWNFDINNQLQLQQQFDVFQQFEVKKLIFSQDGKWLVCCNENNLSIINVSNIQNDGQLENIKQIPGLNYNEKDQFNFSIDLLQYSFDSKQLLQFNPQQEQCKILKQFDQNCEAQTFSSSGKYFAFVNKSEVIIYNISNQEGYLNQKVKHEINTIQFSNNETQQQLVTLNHTQIYIYLITKENSIRMLQQIQVIQLNQVHSLQFHPNDLQFLVVTNREIFLYDKQQQSTQYKMSKKFTGSDELCSLNTEITELRISSEFEQQNLRLLLIQKGAITKPIST